MFLGIHLLKQLGDTCPQRYATDVPEMRLFLTVLPRWSQLQQILRAISLYKLVKVIPHTSNNQYTFILGMRPNRQLIQISNIIFCLKCLSMLSSAEHADRSRARTVGDDADDEHHYVHHRHHLRWFSDLAVSAIQCFRPLGCSTTFLMPHAWSSTVAQNCQQASTLLILIRSTDKIDIPVRY